MTSRWLQTNGAILCLLAGIGIIVYINSFSNSFQYDDQVTIEHNRDIRTLGNIPRFFVKPKLLTAVILPQEAGHYRPFVITSYAINYAIGGLNPAGYHIVNLALHVGSAFLIFLIVQAMLTTGISSPGEGGWWRLGLAGVSAGLIFLVHPFNSEAVNYITARSSVMSGLFYLLGFYCWVRFRNSPPFASENAPIQPSFPRNLSPQDLSGEWESRTRPNDLDSRLRGNDVFMTICEPEAHDGSPLNKVGLKVVFYTASLLAFAAGMLSKEMVITLPIVFFLYDLYFKDIRSSGVRSPGSVPGFLFNWRTYVPYIPFVLLVTAPYLYMRMSSFGRVLPHFTRDMGTQIFTELPVLIKHLQMFLIPIPLTVFHHVELYTGFWLFPVLSSALIILIYLAVAMFLFRTSMHTWRVVSFFLVWFFIVLLPVIVIPLNAVFQENRGYLAVMSFTVVAGVSIEELRRKRGWRQAVLALAALSAVYSVVTLHRNTVWKDELSLWSDAVKKAPLSPEVYTALGFAYRNAGLYPQAVGASEKALTLGGEGNYFAHENLGMVYMAQERWTMAAEELEKAIQGNSYKAQNHFNLGIVYDKLEKPDLAEREYKEALRLDQDYYRPYVKLGILYSRDGRIDEAIQTFSRALSVSPEQLLPRFFLGTLLEGTGRKEEARQYYMQIVEHGGEGDEAIVREARKRLELMGQ
ncbi:MAG: tetratricopeptide repeat protein [Nitrospirae bacterium]|nr:tetratricopeptide repeat protein [Nitrospirota bacterium]